ncbi:MAG: 16S rRNA (adenine(1518)-N(6)/adenine(1519)-N(6))-dimethyltransferase RsmA [Bacilli bacterium]|nr:16S rRNA (adenine(1518)-N(6)/adenine(1519)-N(6))-dimethyltransferase RsmA [Bacilli bacterium]
MNSKLDNQIRKSIVSQSDFFAKKQLSQNFLLDENIITKIIKNAEIDEATGVIEVGPGLGALTKHIVRQAKKLLVYEIDSDLIPHLEKFFEEEENFHLLNQDILKSDINKDIENYLGGVERIVVISNLPYHITTPIIMKFLEEVHSINSLVLMMQLEVAKRITSKPNTKDYNALSVVIQHQTMARYLFKVPKTVFYPQPKVDSAVIRLDVMQDINNRNYKDFYDFVHKCFAQRRKTLVNNIVNGYNKYTKEELTSILEQQNLNPLTRAEALTLEDFVLLYEKHFKDNN